MPENSDAASGGDGDSGNASQSVRLAVSQSTGQRRQ